MDEKPNPESTKTTPSTVEKQEPEKKLDFFEKYLAVWVALCIIIGIVLSVTVPGLSEAIDSWSFGDEDTIGKVSIPIGICLFLMMYPALLNLQVSELKKVVKHPKAITVTLVSNWLIAPFLHAALANALLTGHEQLIVAVILLGASPCTAMVLVWGSLAGANQEQNFVNTSLNTVTIIFLYAPVVMFLTGMQNIHLNWLTLLVTVAVFIGLPLIVGVISKKLLIKYKGEKWFTTIYRPLIGKVAIGALLMTLVVLFSLNGKVLIGFPYLLLLVSAPLLILYPVIVAINLAVVKLLKFKYKEAATTVIIGSSSHFEIAIATAVGLYGVGSEAALGTTMGLFWEVPIMLSLVYFLKKLRDKNFFGDFPKENSIKQT